MESKKTKISSKAVKKETKKVIDYSEILNKIFYSLIAIIIILILLLIVGIVKNNNGSSNISNSTEEEASGDYDVSMFETLTTGDAINKIKEGKTEVVYIGRSTCGYCVKFLPTLQQAQKDYNYKTIYINIEEMTSDDQNKLLELDNDEKYISENFGYTPMVLIFKDGKLVNGWVGYAEYDSFAAFLEDNGLSK